MDTDTTIGELLRQGLISQGDVDAVVAAGVSATPARLLPIGEARTLNLAKFLRAHSFVGKTLRDPDASEGLKRAALRKVILQVRLENGGGCRENCCFPDGDNAA